MPSWDWLHVTVSSEWLFRVRLIKHYQILRTRPVAVDQSIKKCAVLPELSHWPYLIGLGARRGGSVGPALAVILAPRQNARPALLSMASGARRPYGRRREDGRPKGRDAGLRRLGSRQPCSRSLAQLFAKGAIWCGEILHEKKGVQ